MDLNPFRTKEKDLLQNLFCVLKDGGNISPKTFQGKEEINKESYQESIEEKYQMNAE
ncbi:hypothetical protein [Saliterribacillus persicus]|uniref:hypothetical protein n=1 Tax=Saliterribacillus persicus TaxID=930114 RepID=UPI001475725C|nr:hypothetical protein [Saliterribacillus persicus]